MLFYKALFFSTEPFISRIHKMFQKKGKKKRNKIELGARIFLQPLYQDNYVLHHVGI